MKKYCQVGDYVTIISQKKSLSRCRGTVGEVTDVDIDIRTKEYIYSVQFPGEILSMTEHCTRNDIKKMTVGEKLIYQLGR